MISAIASGIDLDPGGHLLQQLQLSFYLEMLFGRDKNIFEIFRHDSRNLKTLAAGRSRGDFGDSLEEWRSLWVFPPGEQELSVFLPSRSVANLS